MAGSSNILQWNPAQSNQETDAQYAADSQRAGGASNPSSFDATLGNKLFYQVTTMIYALAQMLADAGATVSDASASALVSTFQQYIALLQSPAFSGTPTAPNPTIGDNTQKIATTHFVQETRLTVAVFSASGSFVVPTGTQKIRARIVGGGGGGAGSNNSVAGGGGGAGGYAEDWLAVTPGETLTITVGAGGGGGAANTDGSAGGTTSILRSSTPILSATGGSGGDGPSHAGTPGSGGFPGVGTVGTLILYGGAGESASGIVNDSAGNGGASAFGGGGRSGSLNGMLGLAPGSGGGGSFVYTGTNSGSGGAGASGEVVIEY